jgi:hypothetical protein
MTAYAVFFCNSECCSIDSVLAMDSDHAIAKVRRARPNIQRVAAVHANLLERVDPELLMAEWVKVSPP